jgi:hypothetical protein
MIWTLIILVVGIVIWFVLRLYDEEYGTTRCPRTNEEENYDELCEQVRANSFFDSLDTDEEFLEIVKDCD